MKVQKEIRETLLKETSAPVTDTTTCIRSNCSMKLSHASVVLCKLLFIRTYKSNHFVLRVIRGHESFYFAKSGNISQMLTIPSRPRNCKDHFEKFITRVYDDAEKLFTNWNVQCIMRIKNVRLNLLMLNILCTSIVKPYCITITIYGYRQLTCFLTFRMSPKRRVFHM